MYGPTGKDLLVLAVVLMVVGFGIGRFVEFAVVWASAHVRVTW